MSSDGIIVSCRCGQRFKAELWLAGRKVPCPVCKQPLVVGQAPQRPAQVQPKAPTVQPKAPTAATIAVACVCGQRFGASPKFWGRQVNCPQCGNQLTIPSAPGTAPRPSTQAAVNAPHVAPSTAPSEDIFASIPSPQNLYYPSAPATALPAHIFPGKKEKPIDDRVVIATVGIGIGVIALIIISMFAVDPIMKFVATNDLQTDEAINRSPAPTTNPSVAGTPERIQDNFASRASPLAQGNSSAIDPVSDAAAESLASDSTQATPNQEFKTSIAPSVSRVADARGLQSKPTFDAAQQSNSASTRLTEPLEKGLLQWMTNPNRQHAGLRRIGPGDHPIEHYSWMCELLPLIGQQEVYDQINFSQSWDVSTNATVARKVIPQFLNPADSRATWQGYPFNAFALTHFVGMSGIEDRRNVVAASLPRSDPRAGIFGYDQVVSTQEITDGTSNTVMAIGSGDIQSPWIQGGGATVRGAREPYFGKITGFGSQGSKHGAIVVMADGSVRHVSSNVDPKVFRGMCTIHGAETIDQKHISVFEMSSTGRR
jgi:hypothetical protein